MSLPKQFIDDIRNRLTLSEVIGKRIKVSRGGREFKACCPFHHEKTPSFTINDQKGFYHCFGCGAHGDVVGFVMQYDNLSFMDAVETLAAQAGLDVPQSTPEEKAKFEKQKTLYDVTEAATKWFENQLFSKAGKEALQYLLGRGLTEETIRNFRIGYAPFDYYASDDVNYVIALKNQNYPFHDLEEVGLAKSSAKGEYPFFRGRIIFPVSDQRGRVVAYGGRILPKYDVKEGDFTPPKYLNSPDTPLFHKGRLLYNFSRARQAGASGEPIILTEGYMDVIALAQAGITGAVAPLGTALTEDQIQLLWKISHYDEKTPYLCFDGDSAGYRAAFRAVERVLPLMQPDYSARFVFMPEGEDPDTLVSKKGKLGFDAMLERALSLFDTVWLKETTGRKIDTPEAKAGLKARLEGLINTIGHHDVQRFYLQEMNSKLYQSMRPAAYSKDFRNGKKGVSAVSPVKKVGKPQMRDNGADARILLACMINHIALFEDKDEFIATLPIPNQELQNLRSDLLDIMASGGYENSAQLQEALSHKGHKKILAELLSNKTYLLAPFARQDADSEDTIQGWENTVTLIKK